MWNYFSLELTSKIPPHKEISTQCFFHIGGYWKTVASLLRGDTFCHVCYPKFYIIELLKPKPELKFGLSNNVYIFSDVWRKY